jgi:hypothetical protein
MVGGGGFTVISGLTLTIDSANVAPQNDFWWAKYHKSSITSRMLPDAWNLLIYCCHLQMRQDLLWSQQTFPYLDRLNP